MNFQKTIFTVAALLISTASQAQVNKIAISGSDTLAGVMNDAIIAAGLNQNITYTGGGSGVGEKALANGEISLTALSREMKPEFLASAQAKGILPIAHVIGLDGLAILVNKSNPTVSMDFTTLTKIFNCEYTSWSQVPGSNKNGAIKVFRRDDKSGTTDTFKHILGLKNFGSCVTVLAETADIADRTASDIDAVGYAGLSGLKEGNRALAIAKTGGQAYEPNTITIRNETYPLSRKLYVYSVSGAKSPEGVEAELLDFVLDRSFLDPILQSHDFVTID